MLKKYLSISLLITEMFLHSILAQEVNTNDIETVKIQLSDMPNNFFYFKKGLQNQLQQIMNKSINFIDLISLKMS